MGLENYFMHHTNRYLRSLCLAAAIATIAASAILVEAKAQEVTVRIYDSNHHDYHNWDARRRSRLAKEDGEQSAVSKGVK